MKNLKSFYEIFEENRWEESVKDFLKNNPEAVKSSKENRWEESVKDFLKNNPEAVKGSKEIYQTLAKERNNKGLYRDVLEKMDEIENMNFLNDAEKKGAIKAFYLLRNYILRK